MFTFISYEKLLLFSDSDMFLLLSPCWDFVFLLSGIGIERKGASYFCEVRLGFRSLSYEDWESEALSISSSRTRSSSSLLSSVCLPMSFSKEITSSSSTSLSFM